MENLNALLVVLNSALEHTPPQTRELLANIAKQQYEELKKKLEAKE